MTGHRAYIRQPWQTRYRCNRCPYIADNTRQKLAHAAITAAEATRQDTP